MEIAKINITIAHLCKLVSNHQLNDLFRELIQIIEEQKPLIHLKDKVRKQAEIYSNLLRYSFTNVNDPERDIIYSKLLKSIYAIIDELKVSLVSENKFLAINTIQREINYEFDSDKTKIEKGVLSEYPSAEANKLFKRIWTSGNLNEEDSSLLAKITKKSKISWVNESVLVSALTISNLMYFDETKLDFLFKFYFRGVDKVWQRALVGLVLNIYFYSDRLTEYPELIKEIDKISKEKDFFKNL